MRLEQLGPDVTGVPVGVTVGVTVIVGVTLGDTEGVTEGVTVGVTVIVGVTVGDTEVLMFMTAGTVSSKTFSLNWSPEFIDKT